MVESAQPSGNRGHPAARPPATSRRRRQAPRHPRRIRVVSCRRLSKRTRQAWECSCAHDDPRGCPRSCPHSCPQNPPRRSSPSPAWWASQRRWASNYLSMTTKAITRRPTRQPSQRTQQNDQPKTPRSQRSTPNLNTPWYLRSAQIRRARWRPRVCRVRVPCSVAQCRSAPSLALACR
jgi:hypothetical protein